MTFGPIIQLSGFSKIWQVLGGLAIIILLVLGSFAIIWVLLAHLVL